MMRYCWRKKIIAFLERYDKSVPVCDVANMLNMDWLTTKQMLEEIYQDKQIGKLRGGRYTRKVSTIKAEE